MPPRRAPSARVPSASTRSQPTRSSSRSASTAGKTGKGVEKSAAEASTSPSPPPPSSRGRRTASRGAQASVKPEPASSGSDENEDEDEDGDGDDGDEESEEEAADDSGGSSASDADADADAEPVPAAKNSPKRERTISRPTAATTTTTTATAAKRRRVAPSSSSNNGSDDGEEDNAADAADDAEADKENLASSNDNADAEDGYATAEEEDDGNASPDADATFVAPSNKPSPSAATPGRFSMPAAAGSLPSVPSTPRGKHPTATPTTPSGLAQPTKRLVIHKLELKDFKSYAGLQTIGPFHKSFSSVVGPNGSGKSNVIDSLLFVFGWRANKMRQGKLSELIHSASQAGRPRPTETKVSVVFREIIDLPGPDAYKVVPKSKLVVTRTAYQNNSSVYHLNGKKSSFTEVTTLLREKGIDLDHKRFLILQGEVESIAQMPPKARNEHEEGLLEYLEDIIGTSRFKDEIEQANKTVEECNEQRGERLGRLKIVQREKDALEPKKREAESLLRDHNSLTRNQSALWQIYTWECRNAMEKAHSTVQALSERIAAEREKHSDAQASITELESSYNAVKREWDDLKREVDKLTKEVEKAEREDLQLGEKRKHLDTKKKKITKAMAEDKKHLTEAKNTQSSSEEDIERLRLELEKLENSLETEEASLETIRDSLKSKTGHLSEQVESKQRELAPWMAKLKEQENAREVSAQEITLIKGRQEDRRAERLAAKEQRDDIKQQLAQKEQELVQLGEEKSDVAMQIRKSEAEARNAQAEFAKLKTAASSARSKADDAKSAQQATASQSSVLTALGRQAELGMIKGFHGRLGSLGVIDDRYDVAISTACPGLDSIVVDTVECAQACIEYLRKNNVGRGNFIVLGSISQAPVERIDTPESVPRLVDLVKPREPRFLPAFYFQLKDTLVARDLGHANRIAYGARRWRVVTLDGQLIDKSGTMSGGGNRVARGGMSSRFADAEYTPEQIARLQQEAVRLEGEVQALGMQIQRRQVELRDLRERPSAIEIEVEKAKMALKVDKERLQDASRRLQELETRGDDNDDADESSRIAYLESQIAAVDKEIAKLHTQTTVYERDIAALQEKILDAGGVSLRTQQSKVDGIREMMDLSSEKSTKAEVAKAKADKDIAKLEASLRKHESGLADLDEELGGLQGSMSDASGAASEMRSRLDERQALMEEKQDSRDDLKSRLDEAVSQINAFRSLEVELKQGIDDGERALADNQRKVAHWEEKLEKLELHHIDGDGDGSEEEEEEEEDGEEEAEAGEADREEEEKSEGEEEREDGEGDDDDDDGEAKKPQSRARVPPAGKKPPRPRPRALASATTLSTFDDDELANMDKDAIKSDIAMYDERVQKGSGNFAILDEYRKREQEFLARAKDLEETTQQRDAAKQQYDLLRKQRLDEFMTGFGTISSKLKEMYQTITLGGNAELELVDSLDPFSEGILFSVMPPKKSWKNISNLSGGEKTLSSLALVFALHVFKPTPLYVMDEIDAALDFRNVSIVANLIKERTKNAQFVIISLRNNMFELASRLVGIYKTNGQTKSLAVENTELSQAMAEEAAAVSATVAASARKARMHPNPPKTPGTMQRPSGGGSMLPPSTSQRTGLGGGGGLPRSSSTLSQSSGNSMPSTPSRPGVGAGGGMSQSQSQSQMRNHVNGPASIFKKSALSQSQSQSQMTASQSHTGLPQTPMRIPQTPRMPKSILARTPRVPSATPRVPSGGSQVGGSSSGGGGGSALAR